MRQIALAALLVIAPTCADNDGPAPGSRAEYEPCEPNLPAEDELCGTGLVCQSYLATAGAYCAPACSTASADIFVQSPECPEFDGFVTYCSESPDSLSCIIRCDTTCPEGLGLSCDPVIGRCLGPDDPS